METFKYSNTDLEQGAVQPWALKVTHIQKTPMFPQGNGPGPFKGWERQGLTSFVQLFQPGSLCPRTFQDLRREFGIPAGQLLMYYQVTSYWKSLGRNPKVFYERTFLDALLNLGAKRN